jgi:hypothetical protein
MDILIKSFNRAYYLDRCLHSIKKHVKNFNGKIFILDDGTPQLFLDKIVSKYPDVILIKSEFYEQKQLLTKEGVKPKEYLIPIDLWVEAAKNASEYFILLEDDIWFTDDIDINDVENELHVNNVILTKLHWIGNAKINLSEKSILKRNLVLIEPKLFTRIPFVYYCIFIFNKFKSRRIFQRLNIHTLDRRLAYYTIYAVAGVIFKRDYFNKLWVNHTNVINEGLQTYNALKIFFKERNKNKYAHYRKEILKTGFMSSATNQNKEHYTGNIDMFVFNKLLNDAWFNNTFDTIKSLPKDISQDDIISVIDNDNEQKISKEDWLKWSNNFKQQYIDIGCLID